MRVVLAVIVWCVLAGINRTCLGSTVPNADAPGDCALHREFLGTRAERIGLEQRVRTNKDDAAAHAELAAHLLKFPKLRTHYDNAANPADRARLELEVAHRLDPASEEAAGILGSLALAGTSTSDLKRAAAVLVNNVQSTCTRNLLARIYIVLARFDDAMKLAGTATDPVGVMLFAEAAMNMPASDTAGARAYWSAVEQSSSAAQLDSVTALSGVLFSPAEQLQWAQARPSERKTQLRKAWSSRAFASAVTEDARLIEHFRRISRARAMYAAPQTIGAPPTGLIGIGPGLLDLGVDDRGATYILHGEPSEIIKTTGGPGIVANETWVYRTPTNGDVALHFVAQSYYPGMRLVDDITLAVGDSKRAGAGPEDVVFKLLQPDALQLIADRVPANPKFGLLYAKLRALEAKIKHSGMAGGPSRGELQQDARMLSLDLAMLVADGRDDIQDFVASDSYSPRYNAPIPFTFQTFDFKSAAGSTSRTIALAVPAGKLTARPVSGGFEYSVKLKYLLADVAGARSLGGQVDTTFTIHVRDALPATALLGLHARIETDVLPAATYRATVEDAHDSGHGQVYGGPTVVRDFRANRLSISDLALGIATPGSWRTDHASLRLNPSDQFKSGEPIVLYYEVYNAGAAVRTTVALEPVHESSAWKEFIRRARPKARSIELTFEINPTNGIAAQLQTLQHELPPGKYRITVTARQQDIESTSSRVFSVVP
jgi:hypothetical protein